MKLFRGCLRTLTNYLRTPKGRHDSCDYLRALVIIFITSLIVTFLIGTVVLHVNN